jgi:hypothetical protein
MPDPIILTTGVGVPLYQQVLAYLATDIDPTTGLIAALGQGVNSLYPNFTTDGPGADRTKCPTPFLVVVSGGMRAKDRRGREHRIIIEVHDDPDHGDQRWPGILTRLKQIISTQQWRPESDDVNRFTTGLYFDEESPPNLPDNRNETLVIQIIFACMSLDRMSDRGYGG